MEQYIYLGKQADVFFVSHVIHDYDKYTYDIDYNILNCLISQNFVENPEESCIVYTLDPRNKKIYVRVIYNSVKKVILKYTKEELRKQYIKLVNIDRNHKNFIINYDYNNKNYLFNEIDLNIKSQNLDEDSNIKIDDVIYIKTFKSININ